MRNLIFPSLVLMLTASAAQAGVVCWTDDRGQKACGDRVPPQYAKKERQSLDAHGRVINTQARQKTPEEIAEASRLEAAAAAEKARFVQQEKYDRYLLQTFASSKELEDSRDSRLRALESQMQLNDKANADAEKSLKTLQDRAAAAKNGGKDPGKLLVQIAEFERSLKQGRMSREQQAKDHAEITAKFGADIERFNALKSGKVQMGAPMPAAPAPAPAPEAAVAPPAN